MTSRTQMHGTTKRFGAGALACLRSERAYVQAPAASTSINPDWRCAP